MVVTIATPLHTVWTATDWTETVYESTGHSNAPSGARRET